MAAALESYSSSSATVIPMSSARRELYVEEVPSQDYDALGTLAQEWQWLVMTKREIKGLSKEADGILTDSSTISKLTKQCLWDPQVTAWLWDRAFVCKEVATGKIQAIALVKNTIEKFRGLKEMKIAHLVSHPDNIRCAINLSIPTRVEGAGTQLCLHIAKLAREANKGIYLESMRSAVPFYKKCGFIEEPRRACDEPDAIPMNNGFSHQKIEEIFTPKPFPHKI